MTPRRRHSFFLDEELSAGLKVYKERDGVPEAEAVRRAVSEFLERRGIKPTAERSGSKTGKRKRR
jgi:hypothetical protein